MMRAARFARQQHNVLKIDQFHLPRRLILVRHGESTANVDPLIYTHTPDWRIPLTTKGAVQAAECGARLRRHVVGEEKVLLYVSPYRRARQTMDAIITELDEERIVGLREDARLREQDVGNFQCPLTMKEQWRERATYGRFFYRFPNGENGADVCDRVSSLLNSVFRERVEGDDAAYADVNILMVSHGLMLRLFIARWFKLPLPVFEEMRNPDNCATIVLERFEDAAGGQRMVMHEDGYRTLGIEHVNRELFDGLGKQRPPQWHYHVQLQDGWRAGEHTGGLGPGSSVAAP